MPRPVYVVGAVLSAVWLLLVWLYVDRQIGFDNLLFLVPTELAFVLVAAVAPLAFIWLVVAFFVLARREIGNRETLFSLARDLAEAAPEAQSETRALTEEMRGQIAELERLTAAARAARDELAGIIEENAGRVASLRDDARRYTEDLGTLAEETAERIGAAMEGSLAARLTGELRDGVAGLEQQVGAITGSARTFAKQIEEVEGLLDSHRLTLAEATARATAQAGEIRSAFASQVQELTQAADGAARRVREVGATIENQVAAFDAATEAMHGRVGTLEETTQRQITLLERAAESAASRAEGLGAVIEKHLAALKAVTEAAEVQIRDLDVRVRQSLAAATEAQSTALSEAVGDAESTLARIGQSLSRSAADGLREEIAAIDAQAETARAKVDAVAATLREAVTGAEQAAADLAARVEAIRTETASAAGEAERIQEAVLDGRREAFLVASAGIVKELNALAVDIDKALEDRVPDNVQRLYDEGDSGIFLRRIVRGRDAYTVPALRERMRVDPAFRRCVETYLRRFEALLRGTSACDPDKVLTAAFLTADVGKVYLILARANQEGEARAAK